MKLIEQFGLEVEAVHPTGSRYICTPIVWDTDEDYVVLVDDDIHKFADSLAKTGWSVQRGEEYSGERQGNFVSVKFYWWNLILVNDRAEFDKWVAATEEARKRNLTNKYDRIKLFEEYKVSIVEKKKKGPPPVQVYNDPVFAPLTNEEEMLLAIDEIDRALQVIQNEQ